MAAVDSGERGGVVQEAPRPDTELVPRETETGSNTSDRYENIFGTGGRAYEHFPSETFRDGQREAVDTIEDSFEQGKRTVVLEGPTGSGKSFIGAAFAKQSNNAHLLCIQKILQNQYQRDFPGFVTMKGRNAYRCKYDDVSCARGLCQLSKKRHHDDCPYKAAKALAKAAPITVHNLHSFYYQNLHLGGFKGRALLIVDEAHALESTYLEFMSFTLDNKLFPDLTVPQRASVDDYVDFVRDVYQLAQGELVELNDLYASEFLTLDDADRREKLVRLVGRVDRFLKTWETQEYVTEYKEGRWHGKDFAGVTFKPLHIGSFLRETLLPYGHRHLMMSATILNKKLFCRNIGIDPDSAAFIQMPSVFPAENRKIVYRGVGMMSRKHIGKTLPKLVDEIERILDKFPERKGIIQTHSEKTARYIKNSLPHPRLTFNKDYQTPDDMLEIHQKKPGSFIVASGLREGIDLKGDLSRIQIFCKVPYPDLGDKRVARRMEIDPAWYGYQTSLMFVQALGRSVRSKTDRALTFVLDGGFYFFYKRNKQFIPPYVREAIIWKTVR